VPGSALGTLQDDDDDDGDGDDGDGGGKARRGHAQHESKEVEIAQLTHQVSTTIASVHIDSDGHYYRPC